MVRIVLLGPPGCGKGTQAERLSIEFNIPHISTGDILRHAIEAGTEYGLTAKGYMDRGELVPDTLVDDIVKERLSRDDCERGFILDGFPRDLEQAEDLDLIAPIDFVFDIAVPDGAIVERLCSRRVCECGQTYNLLHNPPKSPGICDRCAHAISQRQDDSEKTIIHRLSVYHKETEPLIGYYLKKKSLVQIDGTEGIDSIYLKIKGYLMGKR
jgi:adenylate kinase